MLYMHTSTRADIVIEDLLGQIKSTRLTTSCKRTTQQFILECLEMVRQYEDLTSLEAHFRPVVKKGILKNSLAGYKPIYDVKTAEDLVLAKGRAAIDYDASDLILNHC